MVDKKIQSIDNSIGARNGGAQYLPTIFFPLPKFIVWNRYTNYVQYTK